LYAMFMDVTMSRSINFPQLLHHNLQRYSLSSWSCPPHPGQSWLVRLGSTNSTGMPSHAALYCNCL
jgi:hypothetical protein